MKTKIDDNKKLTCDQVRRCFYCGQIAQIVWVHGHGQCVSCGVNVEECCSGESKTK